MRQATERCIDPMSNDQRLFQYVIKREKSNHKLKHMYFPTTHSSREKKPKHLSDKHVPEYAYPLNVYGL